MKIITIMSLGLSIFAMPLSQAAQAGKIDQFFMCKLTVQEAGESKYPLFAPRQKKEEVMEKFNIVGINCRNENRII